MLALAATEAEVISGTGTQDSVGPFAFTEVEWKASNDPSETELYDRDRFDPFRQPIVAARRVAKLATQARALFPSERMPTSEELYLAWMFGIPALKALRQDPPDRLVSETLTKAMAPFEVDGIFEKRPTLLRKGMTIRELRSDVTNRLSRNLPATAELMVSVATDRLDADASANEALLASAIGRRGFETAQGLSIVGARAVAAVVHGEDVADLFEENGTHHVRGHRRGQPQTTLIKLENGNWIAACILPDFVGTIVVKDGVAVSVRYRPDLHGRFHSEAFKHVAGLVNRWTALMQQGRFGNYGELETAAESLRQYKHSDPSLGVLAAYAYERAGNLAQIDDIAWWFAQEDQPIPFDVALLSTSDMTLLNGVHHIEAKGLSGNTSRGTVAGSFPYLTQGWSFLDPDDKAIHPALFDLRKGLLPALCTTLRVEEGDKVANLVHRGEL
jgi:hypothetical protein